ncbi:MAG: hypothetical protein IT458_20525 [Planctomycetes bacterium]|nr:hypothetical protein [Planctomycetota bacterium]
MGLINWIFDFYQHYKIGQLNDDLVRARAEASAVRGRGGAVDVARLEQALGELALAVKTVQRMAVEKGLCTAEEFHARLREIDLEDGRADGRSTLS